MTNNKFYQTWHNMLQRCTNHKNNKYKYYGGRGIVVCNEWKEYENFENDMYDEYGYWIELNYGKRNTQCTLDKIDNDGNYCKENCRWTSQKEQCNNRRNRWEGHIYQSDEKHKEKAIERVRKWQENNKERVIAYRKAYYQNKKNCIIKYP